jgi:hypothetical protein
MESCAISVYKLSRNKGILFLFFGFLAGQDVVSYPIHGTKKPTGCRLLL